MSGRRFGVGRITPQDRPTESARATPDGAKPQTGSPPGGERRGDQALSPSVAEGHARQQRWRGHPMDAPKAHERPAPTWRDGREIGEYGAPTDRRSGPLQRAGRIGPLRITDDASTRAGRRRPQARERKSPGRQRPWRRCTNTLAPARTARGDKTQEPRPVTRGRFGLASHSGWKASGRPDVTKALNHASGCSHRGNGRWVRAAETPPHPRAGATPRRAETPGAPPVQHMRGAPARPCDGSRG
jgi:hypothetical protein